MVFNRELLLFLAVLLFLPYALAQSCGLVGYQDVCPDGYVCWGVSGSFSGTCRQLGWIQDGGGCDYDSLDVNTVFTDELCASGNCDSGICCSGENCCSMNSDCPGWMSRYEVCNTATSTCVANSAGYCGDGSCGTGESCSSCSSDCGACLVSAYCGDGSCNNGESCSSCSSDCGACQVSTLKPDGSHCSSDSDCMSSNCNSYGSENFGPTNGNCCAYGKKCCQEEHDDIIASHYPEMLGKYECDDSYYYLVRIPGTEEVIDNTVAYVPSTDSTNLPYVSSDGVSISCYAYDMSDGTIGAISTYPNCAFDDTAGASDKFDGIWTGSYTLSDSQICLKIFGLTAPNNPTHSLDVGYTVTLPEGYIFEGVGLNQESWVVKSYAGNPAGVDEERCLPIVKELSETVSAPAQPVAVSSEPVTQEAVLPTLAPAAGLVTNFDTLDDEAREIKTLVEEIYPRIVAIFDENSNNIFSGSRVFEPGITLKMTDDISMWEESTNTLYIIHKSAYGSMANYPIDAVQKNAIAHELAHYHMNGFAASGGLNYRKVPLWFREGMAEYIAHKYYDKYLRTSPNDRTVSQHRYDILIGYLTFRGGNLYKENVEEKAIEKISWESEGEMEHIADRDHIHYGAAFSFIEFFVDTFKPTTPGYSSMDLLKLNFMEGASKGIFEDFKLYIDAPYNANLQDSLDNVKHAWFSFINDREGIVTSLDPKPFIMVRIANGLISLLKAVIPFW